MEKISAVQDDINEVTDIMRHNIEKAVQRGEQLEMVSLRPGSVHPLRSAPECMQRRGSASRQIPRSQREREGVPEAVCRTEERTVVEELQDSALSALCDLLACFGHPRVEVRVDIAVVSAAHRGLIG